MDHPTVSVIIPAYNRAWSLSRSIDSVFLQTFKDFELIIVDDGSTDDTASVLAKYGNRIQILSQENRGASAARNAGIGASRGEYIAFLDSDDEWLPEKLQAQIEFFQKNPESMICQTTERWIRHGRFANKPDTHKKVGGDIFPQSLKRCMITCSSVMIRRKLFDEVGLFNESLPICEDYDLWLRIAYRYPIGLIEQELLIRYGGHEDQLSGSSHGNDRYRIRALMDLLALHPLKDDQRAAAIAEFNAKCRVYGKGCMKRGKLEEGKRFLGMAKADTF